MTAPYPFWKVLLLVPAPEDQKLTQIAQKYRQKAVALGFSSVQFGIVNKGDEKGIWIGCPNILEGLACNLGLFGDQEVKKTEYFCFAEKTNPHIDRFCVESAKDFLVEREIPFFYGQKEDKHLYHLGKLSHQIQFLSLLAGFETVPEPIFPIRPAAPPHESFYVSLKNKLVS